MDLQAIIQMLGQLGTGGTATGQTNQPQPTGINLASLAIPPTPVQSQGGQPNLPAAISTQQGAPLENRAAPPSPGIGLTGPGPQLNSPTVPPIPDAPMAPTAPKPSMYDTALSQQQAAIQKQKDSMGVNFGEHPIKSILNIIASLGQAAGYGFNMQESPWQKKLDALNQPGLASGLAREQVQGQTEGQLAPLKVQEAQTNIAGEQQTQSQSAEAFPAKLRLLNQQGRMLRSHATYFRRIAGNKANPKVAAIAKETDQLIRQADAIRSQITAAMATPTTANNATIPGLQKQFDDLFKEIATRRQSVDQMVGYEGGQPGSAAQPGPDQQIPTGDVLGLGL